MASRGRRQTRKIPKKKRVSTHRNSVKLGNVTPAPTKSFRSPPPSWNKKKKKLGKTCGAITCEAVARPEIRYGKMRWKTSPKLDFFVPPGFHFVCACVCVLLYSSFFLFPTKNLVKKKKMKKRSLANRSVPSTAAHVATLQMTVCPPGYRIFTELCWFLPSFTGFYWFFFWVSPSFTGSNRVLLGFT